MSFQSGNGPGWVWALALSLLLHFLLLWPSLPSWPAASLSQPLVATLRAPATPSPASPPVLASTARVERPEEAPAPTPEHLPAPQAAPQANTLMDSTAAGNSRSEATARAAPAAAPTLQAMTAPPGDGLDPEGLRGYRLALAREARRFKRYPDLATEAGWGGTAQVRVVVATGGVAQDVQLAHTSGHAVLDQAALEMLRRALPLASVPASLRSRAFAVDLPVVFEPPAD